MNQIKIGAILSYIALALGAIITLVYTPFMLQKLGQAEYGLYSLVNTTIAYLTILDFGFGNAIIRYSAKYRAENNKEKEATMLGMFKLLYIGIGVISFLLSLLIVFNIENLFAASLSESDLSIAKTLMWLAAINLAISFPFSIYASIIIAYERFIFAKSLKIIQLITNPLLMVVVLTLGYRSVGMIAATTLLNIVFNFFNVLYCKKVLAIKMNFKGFGISLLKEISIFSAYVFLGIIVDRIYWSTGQFLLGVFVNTLAVAVFAIGIQFITQFYMPMSTAIAGLFLPKLTAISTNDTDNKMLSDIFIRVGRVQFIIVALAISGFVLFGRQFIRFWAGEAYVESYYVAIIMMIPLTIPLIQNIGTHILQAKNMHAFRSISYLVIAFLNIVISIPLIKLWGPLGSAASTAFSLIAGQIIVMNIYYYKKLKIDIPKFWIEIIQMTPAVFVSCGFGILLVRLIPPENLLNLVANIVSYTVFYALCMWLFGINKYERELFAEPIKRVCRGFIYT